MADPKSLDGWPGLGQVILDQLSALRREVAELKALASARVVLLQENVSADDEEDEPEAFLTEDDVAGLRRALVSLADDTETLSVRVTPEDVVFGLLPEEMFDIICDGVSAWSVESEAVLTAEEEAAADADLRACMSEIARRNAVAVEIDQMLTDWATSLTRSCPSCGMAVSPLSATAQCDEGRVTVGGDDGKVECDLCGDPVCKIDCVSKNGLAHLCRKCADGLP